MVSLPFKLRQLEEGRKMDDIKIPQEIVQKKAVDTNSGIDLDAGSVADSVVDTVVEVVSESVSAVVGAIVDAFTDL